jgi:hypothetical protein
MPIHKFQFSRQVGNHFPKKVGIYLVSIFYFFSFLQFFGFQILPKKISKKFSKIIRTYTPQEKKNPIFSPQKITKW